MPDGSLMPTPDLLQRRLCALNEARFLPGQPGPEWEAEIQYLATMQTEEGHWLEAARQAVAARAAQAPERGRMDLRTYGIGAQILRDCGVHKMQLMGNPRRMPSMAGYGLETAGYLTRQQLKE